MVILGLEFSLFPPQVFLPVSSLTANRYFAIYGIPKRAKIPYVVREWQPAVTTNISLSGMLIFVKGHHDFATYRENEAAFSVF